MSVYTKIIVEQLGKLKRPEIDPRHVEAFLRCEYGVLDHLSRPRFNREVKLAVAAIDADPSLGEGLALSYGRFKKPPTEDT